MWSALCRFSSFGSWRIAHASSSLGVVCFRWRSSLRIWAAFGDGNAVSGLFGLQVEICGGPWLLNRWDSEGLLKERVYRTVSLASERLTYDSTACFLAYLCVCHCCYWVQSYGPLAGGRGRTTVTYLLRQTDRFADLWLVFDS